MIDTENPIFLGLTGKALTGKSTVAEALSPIADFVEEQKADPNSIKWVKLDLAAPIYELATIRQMVEGEQAKDRQLYQIHKVLTNVFAESPLYGAPPYDELVELVYEIGHCPCERDGKPRTFLQYVGTDLIRKNYPNVWVDHLERSARRELYRYNNECELLDVDPRQFGVVIGDMRFKNEADFIKEQPNGFLVRYTASPKVCQERSLKRDGYELSEEQLAHASENDLNDYDESNFDLILDTSNLSIKDQINETLSALKKKEQVHS